jgi:phytoene synthase
MAATYRALLKAIESNDFRVLDRRVTLSPLRKAWIAWTTSWSY